MNAESDWTWTGNTADRVICPDCGVMVRRPTSDAGSVIYGCACGRTAWWAGSDEPQVIPGDWHCTGCKHAFGPVSDDCCTCCKAHQREKKGSTVVDHNRIPDTGGAK